MIGVSCILPFSLCLERSLCGECMTLLYLPYLLYLPTSLPLCDEERHACLGLIE